MNKDYVLLGIVTFMSLAANLPPKLIGLNGVDRKLLLIGLLVVVVVVSIALVRYSKFALVLAVVILAVGANLPAEIAGALNIESKILLLTLAAIVLFSLANRLLKLPSGIDKPQGLVSNEGVQALFKAIAAGRTQIASRLIGAGTNVNARSRQGYTALMIAASHGHEEIVQLLLDSGADLTTVDSEGRNALQFAKEAGRDKCVALLLAASKSEFSIAQDALAKKIVEDVGVDRIPCSNPRNSRFGLD